MKPLQSILVVVVEDDVAVAASLATQAARVVAVVEATSGEKACGAGSPSPLPWAATAVATVIGPVVATGTAGGFVRSLVSCRSIVRFALGARLAQSHFYQMASAV